MRDLKESVFNAAAGYALDVQGIQRMCQELERSGYDVFYSNYMDNLTIIAVEDRTNAFPAFAPMIGAWHKDHSITSLFDVGMDAEKSEAFSDTYSEYFEHGNPYQSVEIFGVVNDGKPLGIVGKKDVESGKLSSQNQLMAEVVQDCILFGNVGVPDKATIEKYLLSR